MKAVVLIRKEPMYRRAAVADGLKRLGYEIVFDRLGNHRPESRDDLLVVWNLRAGMDESQALLWEQRGGTVIVMENGYLAKTEKTHYAVSVHGHNGSGWFPDGHEDRYGALGFPPPQRWRDDGEHILVCGQRQIGSTMMRSPAQWMERTARKLQGRMCLRPHPGNFKAKVPLEDDLRRASSCLIWSSASGVRALTLGVPVFYDAPHWICEAAAKPVSAFLLGHKPLESMEQVYLTLNHMAHSQWGVAEIEQGEPFARMKAFGWGLK